MSTTMHTTATPAAIDHFMQGQVVCWNGHDKAGFMALYRDMAPVMLDIQYAGRERQHDGWLVIEEMWDKHNHQFRLEVVTSIQNGQEVAVRHRNCIIGTALVIESIETYRFDAGSLSICYFLKPPVGAEVALEQFRGFAASAA
jgi:hypothetical protein